MNGFCQLLTDNENSSSTETTSDWIFLKPDNQTQNAGSGLNNLKWSIGTAEECGGKSCLFNYQDNVMDMDNKNQTYLHKLTCIDEYGMDADCHELYSSKSWQLPEGHRVRVSNNNNSLNKILTCNNLWNSEILGSDGWWWSIRSKD